MLWEPVNLTAVCPANTLVSACSSFGFVYLNLLVQLYADSWDRRVQEKIRYSNEERGITDNYGEEDEVYDFIVVGAGAAGCVVANRLSAFEHWKVLLLEAGGEQPDITLVPALSDALLGTNIDWQYETEPNGKSCLAFKGQRCSWPRGKMMGGSSSINSFVYVRGNREDYDGWAAMGNEGWSYEDVLPYFKKSEKNLDIEGLDRQYHGVSGEQPISRFPYNDDPSNMMVEAFNEIGIPIGDHNGASQLRTTQAQAISQDGERVSTNNAFIQPIRYKRKNLTVKINSEVIKIIIDKDNVARGVKYINNGTVHTVYAKKEVIVSGGTINSPKLLMLSGVGSEIHLSKLNITVKKNLAVGENLHDHVSFDGLIMTLSNKTSTLVDDKQVLKDVSEYSEMKVKIGPIAGNGPNNFIAFVKTQINLSAPDVQYQVENAVLKEFLHEPTTSTRIRIYPKAFYNALIPRISNLVPKSRGKLLLNLVNPHGKPLIYPAYLKDARDFVPLVKGVRILFTLEKTKAFISRGVSFVRTPLKACRNYTWGTDEYIVCIIKAYTSSTYHPVGTCKMGPNWDRKAVVDPKLRVYGISHLRVIDASIMPRIIRGNTNAPSIMIGEKGAAMVIQEWLEKCIKIRC